MDKFWLPEFEALAQYNSEKSRGIMHSPEYSEAMKKLQEKYNERLANFNAAQQSVQRMGLLARLSKWFGAIAHR